MDEFDHSLFNEWAEKVPKICEESLNKNLFIVNDDRLIESNFDPQLAAILRETRYMMIMSRNEMPQEAIYLFSRTQFFFENTYNISLITTW